MVSRLPDLSRPRLMAILNATPDSFSDGGLLYRNQKLDKDLVARRVDQLIRQGADILDIGGESTRPGAQAVSPQEEMDRVLPIVEWISANADVAVSVDTSSPVLMLEAAKKGAALINDVRALSKGGALVAAAKAGLPVCLMHMQGSPQTMQQHPEYVDPVRDVIAFLQHRVLNCLEVGISRENIWLDPGFGFGKTLEHNLALMRYLPELVGLGFPVLVGVSRKSMIGQMLGRELEERLSGSLALAMMALERGAKILRVHDVAETRDVIETFLAVKG